MNVPASNAPDDATHPPSASEALIPAHPNPDSTVTSTSAPAQSPRALLKSLQTEFAVFRDSKPLAIGIDKALLARQPGLQKKTLRVALSLHTHSMRYLRIMEKATHRYDLDGNPTEALTQEHRQHAADTIKERLKKQAEERRAQLQAEKEAEAERLRTEKLAALAEKFARK